MQLNPDQLRTLFAKYGFYSDCPVRLPNGVLGKVMAESRTKVLVRTQRGAVYSVESAKLQPYYGEA